MSNLFFLYFHLLAGQNWSIDYIITIIHILDI